LQLHYFNKFFSRFGTNKTSSKSKELPNSSWKGIVPIPTTRYLASSPSSTYTPESYFIKLENNSWADVTCGDAPLSKYHAFLEIVLAERQDTNEKSFSNLATNSFIWVFAKDATCFCY
jgi:hypothetical protein